VYLVGHLRLKANNRRVVEREDNALQMEVCDELIETEKSVFECLALVDVSSMAFSSHTTHVTFLLMRLATVPPFYCVSSLWPKSENLQVKKTV
jgi:hypothetical protein